MFKLLLATSGPKLIRLLCYCAAFSIRMPPKKGMGRGRDRGKAKGRGKAKAKQVVLAKETDAFDENRNPLVDGPGAGIVEVIPKAKAKGKASAIRKKIMNELGEKRIEEALAEAKLSLQQADALIEESRKQRRKLLEEQKRLAMLEVMAINASKIKLLEERRKAASEAAEAAKRAMLEQDQKQKALEATRVRAVVEEARASLGAAKRMGHGVKRALELGSAAESPAKKHIEEAQTVLAMLADQEDIE